MPSKAELEKEIANLRAVLATSQAPPPAPAIIPLVGSNNDTPAKTDPVPDPDPATWPAFSWRAVRTVWTGSKWVKIATVALIVVAIAVAAIVYWPESISTRPDRSSVPSIAGKWKYRCVSLGSNFEQGEKERYGTLLFAPQHDHFGISLRISGERKWMVAAQNGTSSLVRVDPARAWGATGSYTSNTSINWIYETAVKGGVGRGITICDIHLKGKDAGHLKGYFYFFPPNETVWGTIELKRVDGEEDTPW